MYVLCICVPHCFLLLLVFKFKFLNLLPHFPDNVMWYLRLKTRNREGKRQTSFFLLSSCSLHLIFISLWKRKRVKTCMWVTYQRLHYTCIGLEKDENRSSLSFLLLPFLSHSINITSIVKKKPIPFGNVKGKRQNTYIQVLHTKATDVIQNSAIFFFLCVIEIVNGSHEGEICVGI